MRRGCILVNWCCMCHRNEETVDYLLLHCPVAHSLWVYIFQIFGIQWVMSGFVENLVYCWSYWRGKFNSDIWNMVPACLMWIVWTERNRHSFEDTEKSLVQLQTLCQKTLFNWSRCWGFLDCSTILKFIYLFFLISKKKYIKRTSRKQEANEGVQRGTQTKRKHKRKQKQIEQIRAKYNEEN